MRDIALYKVKEMDETVKKKFIYMSEVTGPNAIKSNNEHMV